MVGSTPEHIAPDSAAVEALTFAQKYTRGDVVYATALLGSTSVEPLADFFGLSPNPEEVQVRVSAQVSAKTPRTAPIAKFICAEPQPGSS